MKNYLAKLGLGVVVGVIGSGAATYAAHYSWTQLNLFYESKDKYNLVNGLCAGVMCYGLLLSTNGTLKLLDNSVK